MEKRLYNICILLFFIIYNSKTKIDKKEIQHIIFPVILLVFTIVINIQQNVYGQNDQKHALPWIGIRVANMTQSITNVLNIDDTIGVIITKIDWGSPAENSGLRIGNKKFF